MKKIFLGVTILIFLAAAGYGQEPKQTLELTGESDQHVIEENISWGEIKNNIQLSLMTSTPSISVLSPCILIFRARNLLENNQMLDAQLPTTNGSKLIIKDPNGEVRMVNQWKEVDGALEFVLPPGEKLLGSFHEEVLGVTEWSSDWFPKADTLKGNYQITWELAHVRSNTIIVEIK